MRRSFEWNVSGMLSQGWKRYLRATFMMETKNRLECQRKYRFSLCFSLLQSEDVRFISEHSFIEGKPSYSSQAQAGLSFEKGDDVLPVLIMIVPSINASIHFLDDVVMTSVWLLFMNHLIIAPLTKTTTSTSTLRL